MSSLEKRRSEVRQLVDRTPSAIKSRMVQLPGEFLQAQMEI